MHERNFICMQTKKSISTKLMDWLMRKRAFRSLNISWNSTETSQQHGVIKKTFLWPEIGEFAQKKPLQDNNKTNAAF